MAGRFQYKITEIHFARKSVNHIPYFTYMLIEGPRGGKYLLDMFNIECIIRQQAKIGALPRIDLRLNRYARENNILSLDTGDDSYTDTDLMRIAKNIGAHPLIRKKNRVDFYSLCNKIDLTFLIKG